MVGRFRETVSLAGENAFDACLLISAPHNFPATKLPPTYTYKPVLCAKFSQVVIDSVLGQLQFYSHLGNGDGGVAATQIENILGYVAFL